MNKDIRVIVKAIKLAANQTGKRPQDVSKTDVLSADDTVVEYQLRKYGGLSNIKAKFFPGPRKDLGEIHDLKAHKSYVGKLEKQLGELLSAEKAIKEVLDKKIIPLPKVKLVNKKTQKTKIKREIVLMLNDTHYGLLVDGEELGGINHYGWLEASRRTAMVLKEAIDFKPHTRGEVETVHLVLNGDLITGLIHGLNYKGLDQWIHQMNGALHILTHVVTHLLANFKNVVVTGVSGNHDDAIHKREHGNRVSSEKYDSYLNSVFYGLSVAFRNNDRASFNFPKTIYANLKLPGGRALVCHGDVLFSKALGNPGTSINVKLLGEEIRKFNASEVARGNEPVSLVLFGHTHTFANFQTSEGVWVYVAPSLSGTDGFAHGLNINANLTGQVVFESTKDFIMGDSRLIRVNKADVNKDLDLIIPVFDRTLSWKK
jgi:predicted phosphodiesterase